MLCGVDNNNQVFFKAPVPGSTEKMTFLLLLYVLVRQYLFASIFLMGFIFYQVFITIAKYGIFYNLNVLLLFTLHSSS